MKQLCAGVIGMLFVLSACNNDLKTIGQGLVNNGNYIGEDLFRISTISTVRLDSFVTSQGLLASSAINELMMGRYAEPKRGGVTEAIPCFQITPQSVPNVSREALLDSVTFEFHFTGKFWGDSVNYEIQEFELWQLKSLPELDYEHNGYFYNTSPVDLDSCIGKVRFIPQRQYINNARFRLKDGVGQIGRVLFDKMRFREDDNIFEVSSSSSAPFLKFLNFFKGVAILPGEHTNCLMTIDAAPDSLYMQFHYREGTANQKLAFKLAQREYQYNRIMTDRADTPFAGLVNQETEVAFAQDQIALSQGLSGYMIKMVLPIVPQYPSYTTIIKAQIEIPVKYESWNPIPPAAKINVYKTDNLNTILSPLQNNSNTAVTGVLEINDQNPEVSRYLFDVTEYYQNQAELPMVTEPQKVLLSVPNLTLSYDYMIMQEEARVRFYYANYKQ